MDTNQRQILLADDDQDDCLFFKEALNELPVAVHLTTVHDGEELMQRLNRQGEPLPHILFLDLNMPRKSGHECLAEIKRDQKLKQLPVIILSTSFEKEMADMLYLIGAHYCIRKPASITQLRQVIQQALTLLTQGSHLQPTKEDFMLSCER
ncbi:response regulator [Spirosoma spitsbergense]|uniref:response regulator n=1 Tax=Spirosoma spitsbergense TaxID=431554 RepID=UPI0003659DD0|nr:response regulator [Spirosoma spitsbergense]